MKTKHTPGPWNAQPGVMGGEWTLRHGPTDEIICIKANEANARLIASAPDLLEALLECRAEISRVNSVAGQTIFNPGTTEAADYAIAKATGGAK